MTDFICRRSLRAELAADALANIRQQGTFVKFVIHEVGNLRVKFAHESTRDRFFDEMGLRLGQQDTA
ncbi:MAG: hypothetical protein ACI8W7_004163 [Gammaproteobacteria bacterium]|jgi:hypothetical protein